MVFFFQGQYVRKRVPNTFASGPFIRIRRNVFKCVGKSRPVPWGIGAHRLRKIRRPYATRSVARECAKRTRKSAGGPGARSSAPGPAGGENFEVLDASIA